MPGARADSSGALIEVARVLMKEGGKSGSADHVADEEVGVVGAVAFGVSLCALSVAGVGVVGLLDAGEDSSVEEGVDVGGGAKGEAKFLPGCERRGVPNEAGVKVREDADDALFDLGIDLFFGELLFCDGDVELDFGYCDGESNPGEQIFFSVAERDLVGFERFETGRGDSDPEDSGGEGAE